MAKKHSTQTDEAYVDVSRSLDQVSVALQQVANCMGFLVIRFSDYRKKTNKECIRFLRSLGFDRRAIAAILGTKPDTVSVELSRFKSSQRRRKTDAEED